MATSRWDVRKSDFRFIKMIRNSEKMKVNNTLFSVDTDAWGGLFDAMTKIMMLAARYRYVLTT